MRAADRLVDPARDDRKTAAIVAAHGRPDADARRITRFDAARAVLRDPAQRQAGGGAEHFDTSDPGATPVFFLDGAEHRRKRATIARFFTPRKIADRYVPIVERVLDEQLGLLRATGEGRLDAMSFDMAVAVAADIVGLTVTDRARMARRLAMSLSAAFYHRRNIVGRAWIAAKKLVNQIDFYWHDVKPTIRDRRANPRDDILSHLIAAGASNRTIMIECMTYAAAGMLTTREFIVMSAWHLFDDPALLQRFRDGGEEDQLAILLEILRLEPIAAFLYRRDEREKVALCLRDANLDESAVGACPHAIDPDRTRTIKANGEFLSFGDGAHHCPGWQVALAETRMFLDALMRVPGIELARRPDIGWSSMLQSYELRGAVVTCDRIAAATMGA